MQIIFEKIVDKVNFYLRQKISNKFWKLKRKLRKLLKKNSDKSKIREDKFRQEKSPSRTAILNEQSRRYCD